MNGEDMERRMHWLKLARELGQEDDFRALLDEVRQQAVSDHTEGLLRWLNDEIRETVDSDQRMGLRQARDHIGQVEWQP